MSVGMAKLRKIAYRAACHNGLTKMGSGILVLPQLLWNIVVSEPDGLNKTWWRHQMDTFSALLALCAGKSLVNGEFPVQRPVTRSFDVFFGLRLNKRLSKQSWGWLFESPSCSLRRHCNEVLFAQHVKSYTHSCRLFHILTSIVLCFSPAGFMEQYINYDLSLSWRCPKYICPNCYSRQYDMLHADK